MEIVKLEPKSDPREIVKTLEELLQRAKDGEFESFVAIVTTRSHYGIRNMNPICGNCEYFDRHYGDCLNAAAPRFQTTADQTCSKFYPNTTETENANEEKSGKEGPAQGQGGGS